MAPDTAGLVARILNDAWMVRHYARGGRMAEGSAQRALRAKSIHKLGLTVRESFERSEDFEALLTAVVDGLRPQEAPPF